MSIQRRDRGRIAALTLAFGLASVAASAQGQEAKAKPTFRAGAAASNITPQIGGPIVGGFSPAPSTHVHDELNARCLVLDDGANKLAIVLCDNVSISREVYDAAKRKAREATGIPEDHMLTASTHTHSATSARPSNTLKGDEPLSDYQEFVASRIADGIVRAYNNLEPARIGWGSVDVPEHLFNRRWHMKPGTPTPSPLGGEDKVVMNPGAGNPNLLKPAGPTDPQVSFISVQSTSGRPIALLANYSLHYVGGVGSGHISADYFGMFAELIGPKIGAKSGPEPPFVGILSNGTSGDVNNINFANPAPRMPAYAKIRAVAEDVATKVANAHREIKFHDWVPLAAAQRELVLATRRPTEEQVAYARMVLDKPADAKPHHRLEKNYATRVLQMADSPSEVSIILQVLRIGDLGIAAIPFEVFTETGLEIKSKSPLKPTFTIELANGGYGYLPTPPQHALGGYETWLGTNKVEIEASTKIVATLMELFNQVKGSTTAAR